MEDTRVDAQGDEARRGPPTCRISTATCGSPRGWACSASVWARMVRSEYGSLSPTAPASSGSAASRAISGSATLRSCRESTEMCHGRNSASLVSCGVMLCRLSSNTPGVSSAASWPPPPTAP